MSGTWCPNCRQPLPGGARACACGADFRGSDAWQPLDHQGKPVPPGQSAENECGPREWRMQWRAPSHMVSLGEQVLAWACSVLALAGLLAWPVLVARFGLTGGKDDWLPAMAIAVLFCVLGSLRTRSRVRRARLSGKYGILDISVRRVSSHPFILSGRVRFAPALALRARQRRWAVELGVDRLKPTADGVVAVSIGHDRQPLRVDGAGALGEFRIACALPVPLPVQPLRITLALAADEMALYGMPLEFPPEIITAIDRVLAPEVARALR